MLLGSVTPILLVIREIWRCYKAKRIGNWFAYYRETSVTFDKLSKEISKSEVKLIDELLKMGYLQNLHIDYEKRSISFFILYYVQKIYGRSEYFGRGSRNICICR